MSTALPKLSLTIEPLGDRVLILPLEAEQVTASGIVIPDTAKGEKPQEGVIIALGKGGIPNEDGKPCVNLSEYLKVGDKVLFGKYAGDEVKVKDEKGKDIELKILHLYSVLGKVA